MPIGLIYLIDFSKLEHKRCACYEAVVANGMGVDDFAIFVVEIAIPCRGVVIFHPDSPMRKVDKVLYANWLNNIASRKQIEIIELLDNRDNCME